MSRIEVENLSISFQLRNSNRIGLGASYESFLALDDINLVIEEGDRVALLGHNGAGKTTLLRALSGILPPTTGRVEASGSMRTALTLSREMVSDASCLENIKLMGLYNGLQGDALRNYIDDVRASADIEKFIFQPLKTLSKGMRSRLVISMALVEESEILIFDEWIAAVDRHQLEGESTLADAVQQAKIFVVATHKLKLIEKYCNRVLILSEGKLIKDLNCQEGLKYYKANRPKTKGIAKA